MKIFSKAITAVLSAFIMMSYTAPTASAVQAVSNPQVKVFCCNGKDCTNTQEFLEKLCTENGICLNDVLKNVKEYCPDGNCSVILPDKSTNAPGEIQTTPTEKTDNPDIVPTETSISVEPETTEFNLAYEVQVLELVNSERAKYNLEPLAMDDNAVKVAHLRAKEIVQSFSHTRPDGSSCFTVANQFGVSYRTAGENIAYGYATPEQVVNGWMNSEGHRKNILSASFSKIGIGCYNNNGTLYWTQFFIG